MNTNAVGTLGTGENSRFTAVSMAVTAMLLGSLALAGCGGGGTAPEGAMATQASADRMSAEGIEGSAFGGASELSEAGGLVDESSTAAAHTAKALDTTADAGEAHAARDRWQSMAYEQRRQLLDSLKSL